MDNGVKWIRLEWRVEKCGEWRSVESGREWRRVKSGGEWSGVSGRLPQFFYSFPTSLSRRSMRGDGRGCSGSEGLIMEWSGLE